MLLEIADFENLGSLKRKYQGFNMQSRLPGIVLCTQIARKVNLFLLGIVDVLGAFPLCV